MPLTPLVEVAGWLRQDRLGTLVVLDATDWHRLHLAPGDRVQVVVDELSDAPQTVEASTRQDGKLWLDVVVRAQSPMVRVRKPRRIV